MNISHEYYHHPKKAIVMAIFLYMLQYQDFFGRYDNVGKKVVGRINLF